MNRQDVEAKIAAADGSLYEQALDRLKTEQDRFMRAVRQEGTPEEDEAAWRDFSALCDRAFGSGRLWVPELVFYLTPLLTVAAAEQDECDRVKAAEDATAGDDEGLAARIRSPMAGIPSLFVCDALADALRVPRDECRRRAGYLSEEYQPSTLPYHEEKANE
jgi:hypothetical protein